MLTGKGIKYIRCFIGETAAEVGFYNYMTRQTINNIESERNDSLISRKLLTDYLIEKFNKVEDSIDLRGRMASAGYRCDDEHFKKLKELESL